MNNPHTRSLALCLTGMLASLPSLPSQAAPGTLANTPLFLTSSVDPNILFLIDNSGSMQNIVPDAPFDPNTNYATCGTAQELSSNFRVDIQITPSGIPYFQACDISDFRQPCGTNYNWGTSAGTGPVSNYQKRCFNPADTYTARLHGNGGGDSNTKFPSGYLPAAYSGNYLNWYFGASPTDFGTGARNKPGTERRMDIARDAATGLVNGLQGVRAGLASYNGANGANIDVPLDAIGSNRNSLLSAIAGLSPNGSTPLAESLRDIGEYFSVGYNGNFTLHPGQSTLAGDPFSEESVSKTTLFQRGYSFTPPATPPIQYFCQKNFAVLMTDGRPQQDQDMGTELEDYDGDCQNASPACLSFDRKPNQTYESAGSDYLDDVAKAWNEIDLRPDLDDFSGDPVTNNLITYTIGFADDQVINDPLMQDTAANGGGLFITAENSTQLVSAFQQAIGDINSQLGSAASVAFNSGSLSTNTLIFLALFNSDDWSGNLLAFGLDPDTGDIDSNDTWDAASVLDSRNLTTAPRTILSYNGTDGIPLEWTSLTPGQQADFRTDAGGNPDTVAAGQERLDYLLGDRTCEIANSASCINHLRPRGSRLGDIVQSGPVFVGEPVLNWPNSAPFPDAIGETYSDFKRNQANRRGVVYVGANDGLLHGFDTQNNGEEVIAYAPNALFSTEARAGYHYLADPAYSHRFYVDLTPTVSDAYIRTSAAGSVGWHTVLIGGLRAGGRGLFALDITDPTAFNNSTAAAANTVMWEFTNADDPDLGFTFSKPSIVPLEDPNGDIQWAAIFGNGYNADGPGATGTAQLFILFLEEGLDGTWDLNGGDYVKIDTGAGSIANADCADPASDCNGLSTPAVVDTDGDGLADRVYAGDLQGKLWVFDLSGGNAGSWGLAYPQPLFQGEPDQAITVSPVVVRNPEVGTVADNHPNTLVMFGTGQYVTLNDLGTTQTQSFYGIWDAGNDLPTLPLRQTDLLEQTIGTGTSGSGNTVRTLTDNNIRFTTGNPDFGWFMDLPETGERSTTDPVVRGDLVFFNTITPETAVCSTGGTSWLMVAKISNGGRPDEVAVDVNNDGVLDALDEVGNDASAGFQVSGLATSPVNLGNKRYVATTETQSGDSVEAQDILNIVTGSTGRLSWEELIVE